MAEELQLRFTHEFTPEIRARLDAHVAAVNARIHPAKLALRSVINDALTEYLDKRAADGGETERAA